jgi:crotonobetainyl-CoA:carnitine CoA-transferase CaiB-like acyl-CoA transferase
VPKGMLVTNAMSADVGSLPLDGLKVIDCATLFAGPVIGSLMADYGADVIKVEHPRGDPVRSMGLGEGGVSMWWAVAARNKRCVTLKLSDPRGRDLLKDLVRDADVVIENFRPGTFERWGLGPDVLHELNPGVVIVRVTGFGQTGPYAKRAGFGTLAEAISGFAHVNGWPDKPPALPPFALGDHVAGLTGCFATMFALWWRDHGGGGAGQVVDTSIFEPLFWMLGPAASLYDRFGVVQGRTGNASPTMTPRDAYRTADGRWLALSGASPSVAVRIMNTVGRADLVSEPWFADPMTRIEHADEIGAAIEEWIGCRTAKDVIAAFDEAGGAIAPIYSIEDIVRDPQYVARQAITEFEDERFGRIKLQNVIPRLSVTPGAIKHLGPDLGAHNREVFVDELGISAEELRTLQADGVI